MPTSRRSWARAALPGRPTSWPQTSMRPPCTVSSPAMQRSSVLLPEPLRPTIGHGLAARHVEADAVEHAQRPEFLHHVLDADDGVGVGVSGRHGPSFPACAAATDSG